jgi:hypothetical protein
MASRRRSNVEQQLEALWGACLKCDHVESETRSIAMVVDALFHAANSRDSKALRTMESAARQYMGKVRRQRGVLPITATRHELMRALLDYAREALANKRFVQRAAVVANFMVHPTYTYMPWLVATMRKRPPLPLQVPGMSAFIRASSEEITKSMEKREDPEDIVVAVLVAYGLKRRTARGWVQSAVRRGHD